MIVALKMIVIAAIIIALIAAAYLFMLYGAIILHVYVERNFNKWKWRWSRLKKKIREMFHGKKVR